LAFSSFEFDLSCESPVTELAKSIKHTVSNGLVMNGQDRYQTTIGSSPAEHQTGPVCCLKAIEGVEGLMSRMVQVLMSQHRYQIETRMSIPLFLSTLEAPGLRIGI